METWEKIVLSVMALGIIMIFIPNINARLRNSPKGNRKDWLGLLVPLGLVILFVVLLINLSR